MLLEADWVPIPSFGINVWPKEAPCEDGPKHHGHVYDVRTDHACIKAVSQFPRKLRPFWWSSAVYSRNFTVVVIFWELCLMRQCSCRWHKRHM